MLKLKNTLIIIGFLFLSFNLLSQNSLQSGCVVYNIKMNPKQSVKNIQGSRGFHQMRKKMENVFPKLKFTLRFDRNESIFFMNPNLEIDGKEFLNKLAIIATRGESKFFINKNEKLVLEQKSYFGEDFLVKFSTDDLKWTLINEKKIIGKYTCYKAAVKRVNSGPLKKGEKFSTYIAWYCPDIPFNFGPYEFTALPGLILELSNDHIIYTASIIKLSKEETKIERPSQGKLITKEEFEGIGKKAFENR
ncbi:conserved hypothetical protein [Tenacibaculum sediminilitoris]|uniref:GLPGLI family protein n=1 Tax=Tenacibaculum sediminilitoris TaxID=1820334 RepID=UPI0038958907